jgi:homoserine acetyltransferase
MPKQIYDVIVVGSGAGGGMAINAEIAPYYSRVERMIGVSSSVQNRPSNPRWRVFAPV